MTKIPIADPQVSEAAQDAVREVLESGQLTEGEVVREFEREFADYVGVEHAVATSSGTTALHAMLESAGIGAGDVVLTTSFSFIASANAVRHAGAKVIFGDVRCDTFNLDPDAVREILAKRDNVTALMPVHLYGLPADMSHFQKIAREHDLMLFEDAAQAHGATYRENMVGSIGDAAAFSFYPTKNMTTGEGGIITTDDQNIADQARRLINHGRTSRYRHEAVGYNYRMTNIAAAIGREQLKQLPDRVIQRQANAEALSSVLPDRKWLKTPATPDDRTHSFHQYTVRTSDRNRIADVLNSKGIGFGMYYSTPIHKQPAYDSAASFPNAEELGFEVLSLPVHPNIDQEDIEFIGETIQDIGGEFE